MNSSETPQRVVHLLMALILLGGCSSTGAQGELERVAKDWSLTIRASQVIPVYPLTEDLQPGDIFLVQVSIDKQQQVFREKGFLPLDNHIGRIPPTGYAKFYDTRFASANTLVLPRDWFASTSGISPALNASFPTYSFSIRRGGGLNLAVPVQGVPIGLSLLGSDAAQGSIVIADAKTYGLDSVSLHKDVLQWASAPENRPFLANFAPSRNDDKEMTQNYIRIVSRVYLTNRLNVSLQSSQTSSGGLSAGAPKPVELLVPKTTGDVQQATMEDYGAGIDKLNKMVEGVLSKAGELIIPGATVKVVAASSNAISLVETFPRPLVIGYLGFDYPIGPYGFLGPPIPTHALLARDLTPKHHVIPQSVTSKRSYDALREADKNGNERAGTLVRELDSLAASVLPATYPCHIVGRSAAESQPAVQIKTGAPLRGDGVRFPVIPAFREQLRDSIQNQASDARRDSDLQKNLQCNQKALESLERKLQEHRLLLHDAIDYANDLGG